MKVKDLIEKLQEYPMDMEVVVDGGLFEYDADLDPREIIVKSGTSFTQYISQRRYEQMYDDAEWDDSFVDEKVIYLG
jgi:hypothetical protein